MATHLRIFTAQNLTMPQYLAPHGPVSAFFSLLLPVFRTCKAFSSRGGNLPCTDYLSALVGGVAMIVGTNNMNIVIAKPYQILSNEILELSIPLI